MNRHRYEEPTVVSSELLRQVLDAFEASLSSEPEMPSHESTMAAADEVIARARRALGSSE